jgi:hypothetical protein
VLTSLWSMTFPGFVYLTYGSGARVIMPFSNASPPIFPRSIEKIPTTSPNQNRKLWACLRCETLRRRRLQRKTRPLPGGKPT